MFLIFLVFAFVNAGFDPTQHENWRFLDNPFCGISALSGYRIIRGERASLAEFPWIVRFGFSFPWSQVIIQYGCGGVILNSRTILTVAHCLTLSNVAKITAVVFGEVNEKTNPDCVNGFCPPPIKTIKVKEKVFHSDYNKNHFDNDIALIRLTQDIEFNEYIRPICLPKGWLTQSNFIGNYATIAGWGINDVRTQGMSPVLLKGAVQVQDNQVCQIIFSGPLIDEQMCAGGPHGEHFCSGDSGGPLMMVSNIDGTLRHYVIGLISLGANPCKAETTSGIYTRVNSYLKWILDNLVDNRNQLKIDY